MRIFYICDVYLNKHMASTTHVKEVVENLIALGHQVTLFAPGYGRYPGLPFALTVYVPTTNIRILRVCVFYALLVPALLWACLRRKPDVMYIREMYLSSTAQAVAKLFAVPNIVEVNGFNDMELEQAGTALWLEITLSRVFQRRNVLWADRIIAVNQKFKVGLIARYRVADERVVVVRNGANTALFRPCDPQDAKRAVGLSPAGRYIGFVGSFYAFHGIDDLIRAFRLLAERVSNLQLLLVGDGAERPRLEVLVQQEGLADRVLFTGAVAYAQVPLYINAAEVCVAPYNRQLQDYDELSPLKIYEYLACERPVVSTSILGPLLTEIHAGLTVTPEQPAELAEAIHRLLEDDVLRATMGRNGRRAVQQAHSWRAVATRLSEVALALSNRESR